MGPVWSLRYLGGDDILVFGQVFGIFSDMEPLDYLTIASLRHGDTNYDCNYIWPFDISAVEVVSRNRIAVACDYKRLVMWDGISGTSVLWSQTMDTPSYLAYDAACGLVAVEKDGIAMSVHSLEDGKKISGGKSKFKIAAEPLSLGGDGLLMIGEGNAAILREGLAQAAEYRAAWLDKGAMSLYTPGFAYVLSSGKLAKLAIK